MKQLSFIWDNNATESQCAIRISKTNDSEFNLSIYDENGERLKGWSGTEAVCTESIIAFLQNSGGKINSVIVINKSDFSEFGDLAERLKAV